jgi:hypothetical protein
LLLAGSKRSFKLTISANSEPSSGGSQQGEESTDAYETEGGASSSTASRGRRGRGRGRGRKRARTDVEEPDDLSIDEEGEEDEEEDEEEEAGADDSGAEEGVRDELVRLGVMDQEADVGALWELDMQRLAGFGFEEYWRVKRGCGRRPGGMHRIFTGLFTPRVETRRDRSGRLRQVIEVRYDDDQRLFMDMRRLVASFTGGAGLEGLKGIIRFISKEHTSAVFRAVQVGRPDTRVDV